MTLEQLRKRIDRLDAQLLRLLNKRADLAVLVGELKKRQGLPLFDAKREQEILKRMAQTNPGPLPDGGVQAIYREILRQARRLERAV